MNDQLLSMADIAALTHVQRPVVTMWRKRPSVAGQVIPFPAPVEVRNGMELFSTDDMVEWLSATGRGNNPQAAEDAGAYVRPPRLPGARVDELDLAEALLCLKALADATLADLSVPELLDLADEHDPDDEFIYSELEAGTAYLSDLMAYVDRLTDGAYDARGALRQLEGRRSASAVRARRDLTPDAVAVVGEVVAAIAEDLALPDTLLIDSTAAPDLMAAAMERLEEGLDVGVRVAARTPGARRAKRAAAIHGWSALPGHAGASVHVGRFPAGGGIDESIPRILADIDDLQLQLADADCAVVIGPSTVLCDALESAESERARDSILRSGRLALVVKLPRGLVVGSPRQPLGLWIFGQSRDELRPKDRLLASADLSNTVLSSGATTDLATDVVASLSPLGQATRHAFRFARFTPLPTVLAANGSLVDPDARSSTPALLRPAEEVLEVRTLVEALDRAANRNHPLRQAISPERSTRPVGPASGALGLLATTPRVRILPGNRTDPALKSTAGTVRVITPDDLDGSTEHFMVDPITLEATHPRARRTEPGDVVFVATPRPRAMVDRDGLNVVAAPLRIIRCASSSHDLVPEAIAATINDLPEEAREWRLWPIPLVDPADAPDLTAALRALDDERDAARERTRNLQALTRALVAGVSRRAITLTSSQPTTVQEGH